VSVWSEEQGGRGEPAETGDATAQQGARGHTAETARCGKPQDGCGTAARDTAQPGHGHGKRSTAKLYFHTFTDNSLAT